MSDSPFPVYRLDQWTTLRLQLLWAYERHMGEATSPLAAGSYSFQTALLIKEGWAEAGDSRASLKRVEAGQWLVLRQGRRVQRFGQDCVLLSVGFRFQLPTGEAVFDQGFPLRIRDADYPALQRTARRVLKEMRYHVGEGFFLRKQSLDMKHYLLSQNALRLFLIELAGVFHAEGLRPQLLRQQHPRVSEALEIIDNALASSGAPPKAADIARRAGLSMTHLDRLMVAGTGHTVHQFVDARRVCLAQDALLAGGSTLKAIAYNLGFSSPSHFNSWFRQRQGETPLRYRNRNLDT
ncbi:MAG: AraC family transcriptional regulator [Opitutaceae bacterium]|jgi:AraC-like DNA-binding protein|nr:AraC family transcriptional regulator [Opitutaceae bacterium]